MKTKLLLLAVLTVFSAKAQFGTIDTTFGTNGVTFTDTSPDNLENANSLVVKPDGKILLTGCSEVLGDQLSLTYAQYNPDGSPDQGFGTNGVLKLGGPSLYVADYQNTSLLLPDGKILTVGSCAGNFYNVGYALRMNPDGSLDTSFGTNGIYRYSNPSKNVQFLGVMLMPGGKIIISANTWISQGPFTATIVRLNADGTLDTSFGTNGSSLPLTAPDNRILSVALQADGKIVGAGYSYVGPGYKMFLARYNPNGSIDAGFGNNGTYFYSTSSRAEKVLVQNDQKILAVGGIAGSVDAVRFNTDGSVDTTYGANGVSESDATASFGTSAMLMPDGKLMACAIASSPTGGLFMLRRYNTDGMIDMTFGDGGTLISDFTNAMNNVAEDLALQGDKLIVSGWANDEYFTVARYTLTENLAVNQNAIATLKVTPNPATDFITASGSDLIGKKYNLLDLTGKTVAAGTISVNRIPVGQLQKGLYLFKIEDGRSEKILIR